MAGSLLKRNPVPASMARWTRGMRAPSGTLEKASRTLTAPQAQGFLELRPQQKLEIAQRGALLLGWGDAFACDHSGRPFQGSVHALVAQPSQIQKCGQQVAIEARDGLRWNGGHGEGAVLVHAVLEDVLAPFPHAGVGTVGSKLTQHGHCPDGGAILGKVTWAGLHPEALLLLRVQNGGHRTGGHHRLACLDDFGVRGRLIQEFDEGEVAYSRVGGVLLQEPGPGVVIQSFQPIVFHGVHSCGSERMLM
jgi:hypothetical protein